MKIVSLKPIIMVIKTIIKNKFSITSVFNTIKYALEYAKIIVLINLNP